MTEAAEVRGVLRLGDILVDRGVIGEEQLEESLFYQKETGARLGESVVALGYATARPGRGGSCLAAPIRPLRAPGDRSRSGHSGSAV